MTKQQLADVYRDYIACLNNRELSRLDRHIHEGVSHNGRQIGVLGYRQMLEKDIADIPDLQFKIELLVVDPPHVASRLHFDCTPSGKFLGLNVAGLKLSFSENVFYEFAEEKIIRVWSIIDKSSIEAQLRADRRRISRRSGAISSSRVPLP